MQKTAWKEYLTFSKKERNAILILIAIIVFFILLPFFIRPDHQVPVIDAQAQQQLQNMQAADSITSYQSNATQSTETQTVTELFYFDPNTLPPDGWKKLGLRNKTIQTICNYRNKGGYFRKPNDLRKIYGLRTDEADRLVPYVKISSSPRNRIYNNYAGSEAGRPVKQKEKYKVIDINTATVEDWKAFPGIGDVLGNRIVKFRNSMGGFSSVEQVKKTYGLPDSTYKAILPYLRLNDSPAGN